MKLEDLAKGVAAQLKINVPVVRSVLLARGSPRETRNALAKSGVDRELMERIGNAARTLIHEELNRLDARAHPPAKKTKSRGRSGPPRRRRP
jgi:hypothetical protein